MPFAPIWQNLVNLFVGAALLPSPWLLGYETQPDAAVNAMIGGLVLMFTAASAVVSSRGWQPLLQGLAGSWLLVSPWMLGFGTRGNATLAAVACGVLSAAMALWIMFSEDALREAVELRDPRTYRAPR